MRTADTSVLVAAFASWHEHHAIAEQELDDVTDLIGHCALETYSVLTRLPAPHRAPPAVVERFIRTRFSAGFLVLDGAKISARLAELPLLGVSGGATYDAMIGATAQHFGVTLISLDRRASRTYEACGAQVKLLAAY